MFQTDPNTGELIIDLETGIPAKTSNKEKVPDAAKEVVSKEEVNKFAPSVEVAAKRYKDLQKWATKVSQEKAALEKRVGRLESNVAKRNADSSKPTIGSVSEAFSELTNTDNIQSYIESVVKAVIHPFVTDTVSKLNDISPMLSDWQTRNELLTLAKDHPDFVKWQKEMLEVNESLEDDSDMTVSELYHEARRRNPDKVEALEKEELQSLQEKHEEGDNEEPVEDGTSDTPDENEATSTSGNNDELADTEEDLVDSDSLLSLIKSPSPKKAATSNDDSRPPNSAPSEENQIMDSIVSALEDLTN